MESIFETLQAIGPIGIFVIAILDSSFLSVPEINDVVVVLNVVENPRLFFFWPLLTTVGSVIGCVILYSLARKGGRAVLHGLGALVPLGQKRSERIRGKLKRIERIFMRFGSWALIIPALCPPPTPFKAFVATAGVLQFPLKRFLLNVAIARSVRYFSQAILAVFYGDRILAFIHRHTALVILLLIAMSLIAMFTYRFVERWLGSHPSPPSEAGCEGNASRSAKADGSGR
ncbi:MAG: hypothetical protein D6723_18580 [Acidobacteria bacterium]|nr:MAG: hypothetical protein D6723_18580 [Acidobacteriota bacterium]